MLKLPYRHPTTLNDFISMVNAVEPLARCGARSRAKHSSTSVGKHNPPSRDLFLRGPRDQRALRGPGGYPLNNTSPVLMRRNHIAFGCLVPVFQTIRRAFLPRRPMPTWRAARSSWRPAMLPRQSSSACSLPLTGASLPPFSSQPSTLSFFPLVVCVERQ